MEELTEEFEALESLTSTPRRSGRKRFADVTTRTPPPPKRKSTPTFLTADKLKKFYMNKTSAKFARQALETIYEDPQSSKTGSQFLIGIPKIKRTINMERIAGTATKQKKICRQKKIKRLGMKGAKFKKLSDEEFRKRLMLIDAFITSENSKTCDLGGGEEREERDNLAGAPLDGCTPGVSEMQEEAMVASPAP